MRRTASLAAVAIAAALGHGGAATAAPWCGGQLDYNCDYYGSNGQVRHCYVWANWRCQDPTFSVSGLPGGTCNGTVDAACSDGGLNCTVWTYTSGCVIGL
jgi:hypothetical protein